MSRWRTVTMAVLAVAVAGCVSPGPVTPTVTDETPSVIPSATATTPAAAPVATPSPTATTASAQPFVPRPMPWKDGGPMLWPLFVDSGLQRPDGGWDIGIGTYGFLDATGRQVVPARYDLYAYCVGENRPTRVVAWRPGRIDVLALDGSVTRTVKLADKTERISFCVDDKAVTVINWDATSDVTTQEGFDLSTGAKVSFPMTQERFTGCVSGDAGYDASPMPEEYPVNVGDGWAANEDWTVFINIETRATVAKPFSSATCGGTGGGFLECDGGRFPLVYDKFGNLTEFASVARAIFAGTLCAPEAARLGQIPYLWATAGQVQGYIDLTGVWHFQEPLRTVLKD